MTFIQVSEKHFLPLKYANRHGLITGVTGSGKSVTLQRLAEQFSRAGVPVLMADVKGDLAGLAVPQSGKPQNPVRFFDVFGEKGAPMTVTADALGPDLLSRLLGLTDAQSGLLEYVFDRGDIEGMSDLLAAIEGFPGGAGTRQAVQRQAMRLARQGGEFLLQAPCFDIGELFNRPDGKGQISIIAAEKLVRNPAAYSTLMMWLISELFERMPEAGDLAKPRLVVSIDEAHLLFAQDGNPAVVKAFENAVRLIRSKGVGIYFVSQSPADFPPAILGQLSNRIQHALRGATPQDQRGIRAAADTMPVNPRINAAEAIGRLAVGEALISLMGMSGQPEPVDVARILLPDCRLGAVSDAERLPFIRYAPKATLPRKASGERVGLPVGFWLGLTSLLGWPVGIYILW